MGLSPGQVLLRLHVAGHRLPWGGWPFPCRGFPRPVPMQSGFRRPRSLAPDASPSKAVRSARDPRPRAGRSRPVVSGSSLGVPQRSPLHRHPRVCPLSVSRGSGLPHPNAFRPCRSSRLRRLAPHTGPRVCCTPQPVLGFVRFPADAPVFTGAPTFLRASSPLRSSFPFAAGDLSPGSLPPRRWLRLTEVLRALDLEALLRSRVPHRWCHHHRCIELPWVPSTQAFTEASQVFLGILPEVLADTLQGAPLPRSPAGRWHP